MPASITEAGGGRRQDEERAPGGSAISRLPDLCGLGGAMSLGTLTWLGRVWGPVPDWGWGLRSPLIFQKVGIPWSVRARGGTNQLSLSSNLAFRHSDIFEGFGNVRRTDGVVCYNFPPFHGCSFLWVPGVTVMNMPLRCLGLGIYWWKASEFTAPLHRGNTSHQLPVEMWILNLNSEKWSFSTLGHWSSLLYQGILGFQTNLYL